MLNRLLSRWVWTRLSLKVMPVMVIQRKSLMEPAYDICGVILVMVKNFASQPRKRSMEVIRKQQKEMNDVKRLAVKM